MVMKNPGAPPSFMETLMNLPDPNKLFGELQRLNGNMEKFQCTMEKMQPDLHKLASSIDGLNAGDIRSLTQALHDSKFGETVKGISEASKALKRFADKLMGPG